MNTCEHLQLEKYKLKVHFLHNNIVYLYALQNITRTHKVDTVSETFQRCKTNL